MKAYLLDLGERVSFTYLYSFTGLLLASGLNFADISALKAAALAAIPAGLTVLHGALAKRVGNPTDASLIDKP